MTHRDRAGDPPGRRGAAGDAGHRQGFPTPPAVRPRGRGGGFPRLSDGVARGSRCRGVAAPRALGRKPWEAVSVGHNQRSLVLLTQATGRDSVNGARTGRPVRQTGRRPESNGDGGAITEMSFYPRFMWITLWARGVPQAMSSRKPSLSLGCLVFRQKY